MTRLGRARQVVDRVRLTFSTFENPMGVLRAIAVRDPEVTFRLGELTIVTPNVAPARGAVYELFGEQEYDLGWFLRGLPADAVVLDIGAHVGCFALDVARRLPAASVYSYEPTPSTAAYAHRNMVANDLDNRVTVLTEGLSDHQGTFSMRDYGPGMAHNGMLYPGGTEDSAIEVPCQTLSGAFAHAGGHVDLVKLDAEGAEYDILLGTDPALLASVQRFVMEFHPSTEHDFEQIRDHLESAGLAMVRRADMGPGLGLAWFSREAMG